MCQPTDSEYSLLRSDNNISILCRKNIPIYILVKGMVSFYHKSFDIGSKKIRIQDWFIFSLNEALKQYSRKAAINQTCGKWTQCQVAACRNIRPEKYMTLYGLQRGVLWDGKMKCCCLEDHD